MQMGYIGMFDLLTPAVPGELPWPVLWIWLMCEATCTPRCQRRPAQYTTPPPPPLKGLAIELSGKWQYLLTWNTHILPIGVGVGLGDRGRTPWCSCGPEEGQTRKFCGWVEGGGALLAGGCLAVAALLCLKGGRDCICPKLQEADEVLICWVAVPLGLLFPIGC